MSQLLHSHGMAGELVAPAWPMLAETQVQEVLLDFPQLGKLEALDWHSPRPFSAAALATTDTGEWFIKRHHPSVRTVAGLEEEHRFIAHLQQHGCPVPQVQLAANHHSAIERHGWTYEIHARAQGADRYRDAQSWEPFQHPAHAEAAGYALAQLHRAAEGYEGAQRTANLLVSRPCWLTSADPLATIEAQASGLPGLARYLASRDWRRELTALLPLQQAACEYLQAQPPLWTHNDWHASNLLWAENPGAHEVASVLDFGLCGRTFALYDLATALERNAIPWLGLDQGITVHADLGTVDQLLAGYARARPLPAASIDALIALLPVVHVDFALSEVAYFEGLLNDRGNADVAWEGYLLRHAQWFDREEGQRLLAHLHQRRGDWQ